MESILTKLFSPLIPIFVIGFAAKLYCSGVFTEVLENYGFVIICMCVVLAMYILLLVALGAGTNFAYIMQNLRNIFPAAAVAFTSGCSLSTMPWTIAGVRKNLHNPALAEAVIPATTNIQQIGDCIANTFICFFLYKGIFGHPPDLLLWLEFSVVFTLMRFATAAVLGGAIFLMLPLYQRYFGFGDEVLAVIVALNVFIDPIITFTNVLANAALCRVFERVWLSINDLMMRLKRQA